MAIALVTVLLVTACGGDGGGTTTTAGGQVTTTSPGTDTTEPSETTQASGETTTTTAAATESGLADIARDALPRPEAEAHEFSTEDAFGFEVDLPVAWTDRENGIWTWFDETDVGRWVMGSTHIPSWETTWTVPGAFVSASSRPEMLQRSQDEFLFLPWLNPDECGEVQRFEYEDERFVGAWDLYDDCEGMVFVVFGFTATDGSHVLYAQITVETDADYEVLDRIVQSFTLNGSLEP